MGAARNQLTTANATLLYLLVTLIIAVAGHGAVGAGRRARVFSFNYFLVAPYYTLAVDDPRELLDLIVYLAAALMAGRLAAYTPRPGRRRQPQRRTAGILYGLTSALNPLTEPKPSAPNCAAW